MSIARFVRTVGGCALLVWGWLLGGAVYAAEVECTVPGDRWVSFGDCVQRLDLQVSTDDPDAEARALFERTRSEGALADVVYAVIRRADRRRAFGGDEAYDWAWWRSFAGRWHLLDDDPEEYFEDVAEAPADDEFLPAERIEARYRLSRILQMRGRETEARKVLRKAGWLLDTAKLAPQGRLAIVTALGRDPVNNRDEWIPVSEAEIDLWTRQYTSGARELGVLDPSLPIFMWAPRFDASCTGEVKLMVVLDAGGRVTSAFASSSTMPPRCMDDWRVALRRWRYPPSDGTTIPATRNVEWTYRSW